MFHRFTKFVLKNKYEIAKKTILTGTFCGMGSGFYKGYDKSRSLPYADSLVETIGGATVGAWVGFMVSITLPITLPIAICTTVFRLADDVLYKQDKNAPGVLLFKNIKMNIEDIFD